MNEQNVNVETIVLLDDGDTWAGSGYVLLITDETKRAFLEEREVEVENDEDLDDLFWDEMRQDKAIRDLDDVAAEISVDELARFYVAHKK